MKHLTLDRTTALYVLTFLLVITGILPRDAMLFVTAALALWMLFAPMDEAVHLFVRCIPLFVALPLTPSFDNFNMWRPLSLLLLLRYVTGEGTRSAIIATLRESMRSPRHWVARHPVAVLLIVLALLAALSLTAAPDPEIGVLRIVYFTNLSFVPLVIWGLFRQRRISLEPLLVSIALPCTVVVVIGAVQLVSTYLIDIYRFMAIWGEGVQLRQFGSAWSYIAVWMGNTWFAYYGVQLSLRMFSTFPDSHSFPTFILLSMPALLALGTRPLIGHARTAGVWALARVRASWSILLVPFAFLAAILSGTRGIWAASVGVMLLIPLLALFMRWRHIDIARRRLFLYAASYLTVFFLLFSVAWPLFTSPQFLVGKSDAELFRNRIRSVIDFGEMSNAIRLEIWKQSVRSISQHPALGIGIGNFPVVLGQHVSLARAGSTAHNLYLHVAAEMGIPALLATMLLLASSLIGAFRWFARSDGIATVAAGSLLLYLPWVYAYVLTDPILFDERVFLLWGTVLAIIWSHDDV